MGTATLRKNTRLQPNNILLFVSESGVVELQPCAVLCEDVGQKAFGLASLPQTWTLPFFSVSSELFKSYSCGNTDKNILLGRWTKLIIESALKVGIKPTDEIFVRSSGCAEGIAKRGKFHSVAGTLSEAAVAIRTCLDRLLADSDLNGERIPLLIQKRCSPCKAKGHLSNERRCYEEKRDWMGEFETTDSDSSAANFQINIRHWRKKPQHNLSTPLACGLSLNISEALKTPADWAFRQNIRVHYEWVWDGRAVYLVQADQESEWTGHDPEKEHKSRVYQGVAFVPQFLRKLSTEDEDAKRFGKIANVFTYLGLGFSIPPFYILDDQEIIRDLCNDKVPETLLSDLTELTKGSLVIRTDIATKDLKSKQLLPRTEELRDASLAIKWMIEQSKKLYNPRQIVAFIFHNFIPAQSAAFAYANPQEPQVQIEALWGLPEGLYYNSHDKYVVDTGRPDINLVSQANVAKFVVREKRNFKRFFVSTTASGEWKTLPIKPPFDWKGALSFDECRKIAYESRRIASAENRAVSIMWFIGIPQEITSSSSIPWYHEPFDISAIRNSLTTRTKTSLDKCFTIQCAKDVEALSSSMEASSRLNRIRVQPLDERLLRDKGTLKKIGELAKSKGATIVLEGAILSHAYYQLFGTGAVVEVVHPFIGFEERHAFNKVVRDLVPDVILARGEKVIASRLEGELLIKALREKLVEEAYDLEAIVSELADVKEVVDALIEHLKVPKKRIATAQSQKRTTRGGFSKGLVLVETESVPPTSRTITHDVLHLEGLVPETSSSKLVDAAEVRRRSQLVEKRTDRRTTAGKVELTLSVQVPVTSCSWSAETIEDQIQGSFGKTLVGRVRGTRKGGRWCLDLAICVEGTQLELFPL